MGKVKVEDIQHLLNTNEVDENKLEKWLVVIDSKVTNSFICEFSDYAATRLTSVAAFQLYNYIKHHRLVMNSDTFNFRPANFIEYAAVSKRTVYNALNELLENEIIYKTEYKDTYFINVLVCFKGSIMRFLKSKKSNTFYAKLASRDSRGKNS